MAILGIDVGGTGIKGAPVDTDDGKLLGERFRVVTPQPATVDDVVDCIGQVADHFNWKGEIGCGFPSVVKKGTIYTAANIDKSWIGVNAKEQIEHRTQCRTHMINDADAAGLAEMHFGAGKDNKGVIFMITIGTGLGTALFVNGELVPNTELGHLSIRGKDAEDRASNRIRLEKELSWKQWSKRFNEYLMDVERLFWPDLIILGGGLSKSTAKFMPHLTVQAPVVPAQMLNEAGIIGAAMAFLHPEI
ncbi:MAG: polyphosphate--glucose phosphotransferase [Candidatus Sumerlaeota bacterium]